MISVRLSGELPSWLVYVAGKVGGGDGREVMMNGSRSVEVCAGDAPTKDRQLKLPT